MKKHRLVTTLSLLGLSLALGLSATQVHADDFSKTSTGQFSVTAGQLSLENIPNFDFGTANLKDLANGTTLKDQTTTNNTLSISDYRGTSNSGWALTASLSDFINTKSSKSVTGAIAFATNNSASGSIGNEASQIWDNKTANLNGSGSVSAKVDNEKTSLTTEANSAVDSGNYEATVTWTLGNTSAN